MPSISLCLITGNEECHVRRFLDSFGPAFDELCLVRAIANQAHDKTVSIAKDWCEKNAKRFRFAEYRNRGWAPNLPENLDVNPNLPETWKHVDDFAAARNSSWNLASGDWILWADLDDVLAEGSAEKIRECAGGADRYDMFYFTYAIRTSMESNMRERMFKRGISRWIQPMHENCRIIDGEQKARACYEPKVVYVHQPDSAKSRDPERNTRIMEYHMRFVDAFPYEIHREYFYKWQHSKSEADAEKATRWAEIAQVTNVLPQQRQQMLLHQAQIIATESVDQAIEICWAALRLLPWHRDPWAVMAELELQRGNAKRAIYFSELMGKHKRPPVDGMPKNDTLHSWQGLHLHLRCLRAGGEEAQARKIEDAFFQQNGARFSLLHATRGRPEMALKAREYFMLSAACPLGVEHIFAIDEDDTASLEALKNYRHIIVKEPHGCVKAWNAAAAASAGHVLIQLSDDWFPCLEWDDRCWEMLTQGAKAKDGTIETTPLVLAISDNRRNDMLLCCAILNRARYLAQGGEMFSPEYFGVFSDNEFSLRAWHDGVVVDARKIIKFQHNHPFFENKPFEEWDEIHRRQNDAARYVEGDAIFKRRNAAYLPPQACTSHSPSYATQPAEQERE